MSRQQRRALDRESQKRRESRRAEFERVHGQVLAGMTIRDLYLTYATTRFQDRTDLNSPVFRDTVEHAFYAGAASMLELMNRVSPDDITEEQGMEMLSRLHEELEAYADRGVS